jgi:diguanylate cyclase (GGDEF)-like protein/PAS domain S-box-containing protein
MSMMFKPPVGRHLGWRDMLTLGPEDDPFWQRVRLSQLRFCDRYLPMNIPVALINGGIVLATIAKDIDPAILYFWMATQLGTIFYALVQRWRMRHRPPRAGATRRESAGYLIQLLIVGLGWGVLFLQGLSRADPTDAMLIVAMTMAGAGCLAFTTATWPLGSIAMSGVVATCTMIGLVSNDWGDAWPVLLVIGSFMLFVARGNLLTTSVFLAQLDLRDRIQEQEEVLRLLLNEYDANGSEWLFEFDSAGICTFISSRFAEATGLPVESVIGTHWQAGLTDLEPARPLIEAIDRGEPYRDFLLPVRINGEDRWWSLSGTPKFDRDGTLLGYRGVGSDVTEKQRAAARIAELATFDALTGLVNRRIVHQALGDGLQAGKVALLFVDLDRFKAVNDSLGHSAGDRLLGEVALRLRDTVAEAAGPRALVGRLGGDEFAVVLREGSADSAQEIGESIIAALSVPYQLGDKRASIGASVGLAVGPEDGTTVEALMRAADLALYDVKGKGRGSVRAYDRAMHARAEDRLALEYHLKSAIEQNQFRLAFQPVVSAIDERVVAFEALLRWRHPTRGDISPAVFIPIAEECGLIGRIGVWVLNEACRTAASWPRHIKIAVNISPLQFDDPKLVEIVRKALARFNIGPERLELELTESVFLDERPQTAAMLKELQQLGVSFALDDFGTGYSSLGYLQKINFRRIKIDRSFVQACASDGGESMAIIQAIVALAERLGMETTAEGTETRAEFEAMRRLGCGQMQGWYFGKPMPADETLRLLDRNRPLIHVMEAEPFSPSRLPRLPAANVRSQAAAEHAKAPRPQAPRAPLRG